MQVADRGPNWPASRESLDAARQFLVGLAAARRVAVAFHGDVDGLAAAVLLLAALERLGSGALPVPAGKGESVHNPTMQARLIAHKPAALIVLDMGSRAGHIIPGLSTLVVDHHQPAGLPLVAVFVSAFGHPPVAPTSLLTYALAGRVADVTDLGWLAALGTVADLGQAQPFPELEPVLRRYGKQKTREAVSLLNAAKRAPAHDVGTALAVLRAARGPADIADGRIPGAEVLSRYREEVRREVERCARTAPRFAGPVALLRFSSPAQVHPLVAIRWVRRLPDRIVVAANEGYLPGRVNFSLRTAGEADLIAFLEAFKAAGVRGEFAYGHPQATGGSLPLDEFERLLVAMGFRRAA